MKKLCCPPCSPELPNLSFDFKCVSACCGGRTGRSDMKSEDAKDEVNNVVAEALQSEEVEVSLCCCKQRRKTQAKDNKTKTSTKS